MARSIAQSLYEVGCAAFDEEMTARDCALVRAIAAMLAEATKPKKRKGGPTYEHRQLGERVYELLASATKMALVPQPNTFGALGKRLSEACITDADIGNFVRWVNAGGLDWMKSPPTWGQFCKYCLDWIAQANSSRPKKEQASPLEELRKSGL